MYLAFCFSIYFIQGYLSGTGYSPLQEIVPSVAVIGSLLLSLVVTSTSEVGVRHTPSNLYAKVVMRHIFFSSFIVVM